MQAFIAEKNTIDEKFYDEKHKNIKNILENIKNLNNNNN